MPNGELCAATLRDGQPCKSVRTVGDYCAGHAKKLAALAEAESAESPSAYEMVEGADSEAEEVPADEPGEVSTSTPVGSLRNELREGLVTSETAGLIRDAILAGLKATKNFWVSCPHCNKRHEAQAPDLGVRVNAAEKLLDQLEGRLRAEAATLDQKVAEAQRQSEQDLASCTDQELMLLVVAENAGRFLSVKESAQQLAAKVIANATASA